MSLRLTKTISTYVFAVITMSACATVDLNQVATPAPTQAAEVEVNVVQRAATRLKDIFTNKGFVAKTSRKRMKSAARVLLNGLEDKKVTKANGQAGYLATPKPAAVIVSDIQFAQQHVVQVTKAAEIYIEMAPSSRNLRKELVSLEAALVASREAAQVFTVALNGYEPAELVKFTTEVDSLRDITDEFGIRVRTHANEKLAEAS